jgi:hypothetical protein
MTFYATVELTRAIAYADLGDAWLRDPMARPGQAHLQFGPAGIWVSTPCRLARAVWRERLSPH